MDAEAVRSFCDATGATEAQAVALLGAYGGNVEAAVNSFFGAASSRTAAAARRATVGARADMTRCATALSPPPRARA
jgi:hypothetical protein